MTCSLMLSAAVLVMAPSDCRERYIVTSHVIDLAIDSWDGYVQTRCHFESIVAQRTFIRVTSISKVP